MPTLAAIEGKEDELARRRTVLFDPDRRFAAAHHSGSTWGVSGPCADIVNPSQMTFTGLEHLRHAVRVVECAAGLAAVDPRPTDHRTEVEDPRVQRTHAGSCPTLVGEMCPSHEWAPADQD